MAKQYLLSFYATIQGQKAVISALKQMERETGQVTKSTITAGEATQTFDDKLRHIAKRALLTIPAWLILRSVFMTLIRTVGDMVRTHFELEEGLARIRTVVRGTSGEVESYMKQIKQIILDVATDTKIPIKDLAEAFYFLQTSSLTAQEAMSAFIPTVNAMTATGVGAKEMARAVAGSFNTMVKFMDDSLSSAEKFNKIADVLTFTFATQDVEMSELVEGYTKLAPYVTGLEEDFTELVTTLGFLNTRLLRSGRTGRLLGRSILQLSKNSEKLAQIFGITFDPDEPIGFLEVIRGIANQLGQNTKITEEQGRALQEVFATRGGVPIRLLVSAIQDLDKAIESAGGSVEGFAQKLAEIRMTTVTAQAQRMRNIFAILFESFVTGATGTGDYAEALKEINDGLKGLILPVQRLGAGFGWLSETISRSAVAWEVLARTRSLKITADIIKETNLGIRTYSEYLESLSKAEERREKEVDLANRLKEETKELAELEQRRLVNTQKITDVFLKAELSMLKVMGVSEYDRLLVQERQLQAQQSIMKAEEYALKLDDLRLKQAVALRNERQQELDLILQYERGDITRRELKRTLELKRMSPEILKERYRYSPYDRELILKHMREFTGEALNKIALYVAERERIFLPTRPGLGRKRGAERALRGARRELGRAGEFETPRILAPADVDLSAEIANINIQLPEGSLDKLAEKTGKAVEEKLRSDETLQRFIAQVIRPYL